MLCSEGLGDAEEPQRREEQEGIFPDSRAVKALSLAKKAFQINRRHDACVLYLAALLRPRGLAPGEIFEALVNR